MRCACTSRKHNWAKDGICTNEVSASEYDPISLCDTCQLDNSLNGDCALPHAPDVLAPLEPIVVQKSDDVEADITKSAEEDFGI